MTRQAESPDSIYTQQVKKLIDAICPADPQKPSVFADARQYYAGTPARITQLKMLEAQADNFRQKHPDESLNPDLVRNIRQTRHTLETDRLARLQRLTEVCNLLLSLSEGDTIKDTQQQSARLLGTIMLLTPGGKGNFARRHQRLKPLYKAVLLLRLVDVLIQDEAIAHPYLQLYREAFSRYQGNSYWQQKWRNELAIPLISSALLQDIGLNHPEAQSILVGDDGEQDEFRLLDEHSRKGLLKLNYAHTLDYLRRGLGVPEFTGTAAEDKHRFVQIHQQANQFREQLVQDAFLSKTGLGELLKVPQIYVSIVLSTKPDYSREELPRGYLLIEQMAKKGAINAKLANTFNKMVGYFPQGFGITFIPVNEQGFEKNQFEYAIVSALNPSNPMEPICRVVSRNLQFISSGADLVIGKAQNLYFQANRKKLKRIDTERLQSIISQLTKNASADATQDLVPGWWEPSDYFGDKKNQNLWSKK